eukprot:TRINITY_DN4833_c0_g1_i2.p1 TRINITY_DN4833_c0_g1~~TRINITY_DN4833_c0_g1_i2.p1  ORF type:complete len:414 (+),score=85.80 TRINITY_DN4833_c0_g1_i2:212-1453(+)
MELHSSLSPELMTSLILNAHLQPPAEASSSTQTPEYVPQGFVAVSEAEAARLMQHMQQQHNLDEWVVVGQMAQPPTLVEPSAPPQDGNSAMFGSFVHMAADGQLQELRYEQHRRWYEQQQVQAAQEQKEKENEVCEREAGLDEEARAALYYKSEDEPAPHHHKESPPTWCVEDVRVEGDPLAEDDYLATNDNIPITYPSVPPLPITTTTLLTIDCDEDCAELNDWVFVNREKECGTKTTQQPTCQGKSIVTTDSCSTYSYSTPTVLSCAPSSAACSTLVQHHYHNNTTTVTRPGFFDNWPSYGVLDKLQVVVLSAAGAFCYGFVVGATEAIRKFMELIMERPIVAGGLGIAAGFMTTLQPQLAGMAVGYVVLGGVVTGTAMAAPVLVLGTTGVFVSAAAYHSYIAAKRLIVGA